VAVVFREEKTGIREKGDPRTYAVIGAAMEVHGLFGDGFLEPVYQEALMLEFQDRQIPFVREANLDVFYKGTKLACSYRADFVCYGSIIVELKALSELSATHESQAINYLKCTGMETALLLNFGRSSLEYKRLILSQR